MSQPMFIEKLNQAVSGKTGCLRYDEYIKFALYDTEFGYYKQAKERIGRIRDADFYTASSMGDVFRELLISAFTKLLAGEQLSEYGFVEIAHLTLGHAALDMAMGWGSHTDSGISLVAVSK